MPKKFDDNSGTTTTYNTQEQVKARNPRSGSDTSPGNKTKPSKASKPRSNKP